MKRIFIRMEEEYRGQLICSEKCIDQVTIDKSILGRIFIVHEALKRMDLEIEEEMIKRASEIKMIK